MKIKTLSAFLIVFAIISSCSKLSQDIPSDGELDMTDLSIPDNFSFKTTKQIRLTVNDAEEVAYDVYTITTDQEAEAIYVGADTLINIDPSNQKIASGFTKNGSWSVDLTLPGHQEFLYVKRKKSGAFSGGLVNANQASVIYNHTAPLKSTKAVSEDFIYAVNGNGQAFYFDIATGNDVLLTNFPKGSYACAVDKANNKLYVAERNSPYKLDAIDLTTGDISTIANLNKQYDRMEYDESKGLIYLCKGKYLYSYDPFAERYISSYQLTGPKNNLGGGDVSVSNGVFYFTSVSQTVLYTGTIDGNKIRTEVVTENLPTTTTSSTIGSDGYLYYATSNNPSKIYKVNKETGASEFLYTLNNYKANDFGILVKDSDPQPEDGDNDGVPDTEDDYPDDPNKAFNIWVPGEDQWGTLAFEDLWPGMGDYDFNDMVVNYKFQQVTNASNQVVELKGYFKNVHEGASLVNGFGFELPILPSQVQSVSGYNITDGKVSLSANGTENGQDKAVVIVYDNGDVNLNSLKTISIELTQPVAQTVMGEPPYNPFLIKNQDRDYEVHLPDTPPTTLANENILNTHHDSSNPNTGRYYKTQNNLPWAINIPVEFVWMNEKVEILNGYLKFKDWAESGGSLFPDWYVDKDGYRNESNLDIQE